MDSTRKVPTPDTAIPPRYVEQRERVLRILRRWENATATRGSRLSDAS